MLSLNSWCLEWRKMLPIFGARQYQMPPKSCFDGFAALRTFALRMCGSKFMYRRDLRGTVTGPHSGDLHLRGSRAKYT